MNDGRNEAITWAEEMLSGEFVVASYLSTHIYSGEPIAVAIINKAGETLFNRRICPQSYQVSLTAERLHGLSTRLLSTEKSFSQLRSPHDKHLNGVNVLVYDARFVRNILTNAYGHLGALSNARLVDVGEHYKTFRSGHNVNKLGRYSLPDACENEQIDNLGSTVLNDAKCLLSLVKRMANSYVITVNVGTASSKVNKDGIDSSPDTDDPLGKVLSPEWLTVESYNTGMITEDSYRRDYLSLLRQRYDSVPSKFTDLLHLEKIILQCDCTSDSFCYHGIAKTVLLRIATKSGYLTRDLGKIT